LQQHVNQDSGWDIPGSPEPGTKEGGWKTNVNNGTELWEANLRNGGQPPPQPAAKTPWGHTPSTNIGGTWGEDDTTDDNTNMWQGVPNNQPSNPQWGGGGGPTAMPKKDNDWSGGGGGGGDGSGGRGGGGSTWGGDSRDMRGGGGGMGMDPRVNERGDMRGSGGMGMDMRGGDMMRPDMMMNQRGGDPRLGRMNGGEPPMWGAPKGQQPPVNQWGGPPPKDMKSHSGGGGGGWEEPSPPAQRRQPGGYDDGGTSLWGNPGNPQQAPTWRGGGGPAKPDGNKVSHWKDIPHPSMGGRGGSGMQCPPGMAQGRGMPGAGGGIKPEAMWGHPQQQRNGSWDGPQGPHDGPGGWGDDGGSKMGWNDQSMMPQGGWGGPKPKNPMGGGGGGWGDGTEVDPSSWGHPKPVSAAFYAQVGFFLWVIPGEHLGFLLQLNQVKFVIKKYLTELLVSHLFDHKFPMILKIYGLSSYLP
jgi:trinucleotide repeat-containing gene 6 protein